MQKGFLKEFPCLCPSGHPPEWSREQPLPSTAMLYSKLILAFRSFFVRDLYSVLTSDRSDNSSEQFLSTTTWTTCTKMYLAGKAMQRIEIWFRVITFSITNVCWDDWRKILWHKVHINSPSNLQLLFQMNSSHCTISRSLNTGLNAQWIRGSTFNTSNLERTSALLNHQVMFHFRSTEHEEK